MIQIDRNPIVLNHSLWTFLPGDISPLKKIKLVMMSSMLYKSCNASITIACICKNTRRVTACNSNTYVD